MQEKDHSITRAALIFLLVIFATYPGVAFLNRTLMPYSLWTEGLMNPVPYGYEGRTLATQISLDPLTAYDHEFPANKLVGEMWRRLELPLWNPYQAGGCPLAADYSTRVFFPYQIILDLFPSTLWDIFFLGRLWIAAFGTYLFLRTLGTNFGASVLGGILYMLGGNIIWFINMEEMVNGAMTLPYFLFFLEKLVQTGRWRYTVLSSVAAACIIFAGQPSVAVQEWVFGGAYFLFRGLALRKSFKFIFGMPVIVLGMGFLLASPLLMIFIEFMEQSYNLHSEPITAGTFQNSFSKVWGSGYQAIIAVIPIYLGQYLKFWSENVSVYWGLIPGYTGVLAVLLILLGLSRPGMQQRGVFIFFVVTTIFIYFMGQHFLPLRYSVQFIPILNKSFSGRWIGPIFNLSAVVSAAIAANNLSGIKPRKVFIAYLALIGFLVGLTTEIISGSIASSSGRFVNQVSSLKESWLFISRLLQGEVISEKLVALFIISVGASVFIIIALVGTATLLLAQDKIISREKVILGITILAVAELWFYAPKGYDEFTTLLLFIPLSFAIVACWLIFNRRKQFLVWIAVCLTVLSAVLIDVTALKGLPARADIFRQPPYVSFLRERTGSDRILGFEGVLGPNFASTVGLYDLRFYNALAVKYYWHFVKDVLLDGREPSAAGIIKFNPAGNGAPGRDWDDYKQAMKKLPFYNLMGVKYFLTKPEKNLLSYKHDIGLKLVYDKEVRIFENLNAFPRAFMTYKVQYGSDNFQEALATLKNMPAEDLGQVAILEERVPEFRQVPGNVSNSVQITTYEPRKVNISVQTAQPGILVLSDVWYPGWVVQVDGRKASVLRVDGFLRGVALAQGTHRVEFAYHPMPFYLGCMLALLGLGISALLLFLDRRKEADRISRHSFTDSFSA